MPWWRYVPGVVVGALFWATIYTTIGFAVLEAWFGDHPWPWVIGAVVAILVVVGHDWLVRRRRAVRPGAGSEDRRGRAAGIGMPRHRGRRGIPSVWFGLVRMVVALAPPRLKNSWPWGSTAGPAR